MLVPVGHLLTADRHDNIVDSVCAWPSSLESILKQRFKSSPNCVFVNAVDPAQPAVFVYGFTWPSKNRPPNRKPTFVTFAFCCGRHQDVWRWTVLHTVFVTGIVSQHVFRSKKPQPWQCFVLTVSRSQSKITTSSNKISSSKSAGQESAPVRSFCWRYLSHTVSGARYPSDEATGQQRWKIPPKPVYEVGGVMQLLSSTLA